MIVSQEEALAWMLCLGAVAVAIQTLELLHVRQSFSDHAIWSWPVIRQDFSFFPNWLLRGFDCALGYQGFIILLITRLVASLAVIAAAPLWAESHARTWLLLATTHLFFSSMLISMRFRGSFNGGSDSMTLIVLGAATLALAFQDQMRIVQGCLWYVAIQACASYFIAGLVKIREKEWRSSKALSLFLSQSNYDVPAHLRAIGQKRIPAFIASWGVLIFECSFPLALINPTACSAYLGVGLFFHLANVYAFGLNRFLHIWLATYPALLFCSRWSAQ